MKRILCFAVTLLALLALCSPVSAMEERQAEVYVNVVRTAEGVYPAPVEDGVPVKVTTDDGITVTVRDLPEGAAVLMVVPVPKSEKEAWKWITSCMDDVANPVHTFEVYFENGDGNRLTADGATVTIDCTHCTGKPMVWSLTTGGKVRTLTDSASGTRVTFTADGSAYYIMAQEDSGAGTDNDFIPKTGDSILLPGTLLASAAPALYLLHRKRKEE